MLPLVCTNVQQACSKQVCVLACYLISVILERILMALHVQNISPVDMDTALLQLYPAMIPIDFPL